MAKGKSADRGREQRWRRVVRQQGRSGGSIRAFCRTKGIKESAFYFWRRELLRRDGRRKRREAPSVEARFLPVTVVPEEAGPEGGRIEIVLSGGPRVCLTGPVDRRALAEVLAVLSVGPGVAGEGRGC